MTCNEHQRNMVILNTFADIIKNHLSIRSKLLNHRNVLDEPPHAFLWDTDTLACIDPWHIKNIYQ